MQQAAHKHYWEKGIIVPNCLYLLSAILTVLLSACTVPAPAAPPAVEEDTPEEADVAAATDNEAEFQRILACVEENFPAESYFTNDLLPDPDAAWKPMACESVDQIKIGMPWVLNDEEASWYNAVELGFYSDVCLDVELVAGGPGVDHLQNLAAAAIDIAVSDGGSRVPSMVFSPTPAAIVAVGTLLKHSPYIWLGLDPDTPQDQRSSRELTPQDFIGKRIGLHGTDGYLFQFISSKYDIPADQVELMEAGFTPDPVLEGTMDYIGAWLINQPRLMEEKGFMNWVAFQFSDWGWDDYADVSVVRRETLEGNPDLVRRYLAATFQGAKYLIENPEASAAIAVTYGVDVPLTKEQALRRFQLQEALVLGHDDLPMFYMSAERWNIQVASMIQYNHLELAACE